MSVLLDLRLPEHTCTAEQLLYREYVMTYLRGPVRDHLTSLMTLAAASRSPYPFLRSVFGDYKLFCAELFTLPAHDEDILNMIVRKKDSSVSGRSLLALCFSVAGGLPVISRAIKQEVDTSRDHTSQECASILRTLLLRSFTELLLIIKDLDTLHVGALCVSKRLSSQMQKIAGISLNKLASVPAALAGTEAELTCKEDRRGYKNSSRNIFAYVSAMDSYQGQAGSRPVIRHWETYARLYQALVENGTLREQLSRQCRTMEDFIRQLQQHVHIPNLLEAQRTGMNAIFNNVFYILGYHVREFTELLTAQAQELEKERMSALKELEYDPALREIVEQYLVLSNISFTDERTFREDFKTLESRSFSAYTQHLGTLMHEELRDERRRDALSRYEDFRDLLVGIMQVLQDEGREKLSRLKNVLLAESIIAEALIDLSMLDTDVIDTPEHRTANAEHLLRAITTLEQFFGDSGLLTDIGAEDRSIFIAFEECVKVVSTVLLEHAPERTKELTAAVEHIAASISVHYPVEDRTLSAFAAFAKEQLLKKNKIEAEETVITLTDRYGSLVRFANEHPIIAIRREGHAFFYKHREELEGPLPQGLTGIIAEAWDTFKIEEEWLILRAAKNDLSASIVTFADDGTKTPYERDIDLMRLPGNYSACSKTSGKELKLPRYNTKEHRIGYKALASMFRTVGRDTRTIAVRTEPLERFGVQVLVRNVDLPQHLSRTLDTGTEGHVRSRAAFYTSFLKNVLKIMLAPKKDQDPSALAMLPAEK